MSDMREVIVPKSDQLNSDDLIAGPITIKVTGVKLSPGTEQPVSVSFEGDNGKPYKPCKSMCRVLVQMWGDKAKNYVGKSMTLYRDPKVKWGGVEIGGIRISHMSDISGDATMALTATKGSRKLFTVKPLKSAPESPKAATREPTQEEIDAGNSAAMSGLAEYKAWIKTLTEEQKIALTPRHAGWIAVAKKSDEDEANAAAMGA